MHWLFIVAVIALLLWVISAFLGSTDGRSRGRGGRWDSASALATAAGVSSGRSTSRDVVNITVGLLFVLVLVGMLLALVFWSSWAGPCHYSRRRTVVDDDSGPRVSEERTQTF